ncbi:hypothetical protein GCM10009566_39550 [Streptomyces murinus]
MFRYVRERNACLLSCPGPGRTKPVTVFEPDFNQLTTGPSSSTHHLPVAARARLVRRRGADTGAAECPPASWDENRTGPRICCPAAQALIGAADLAARSIFAR